MIAKFHRMSEGYVQPEAFPGWGYSSTYII
jgi:hypothetical protein